MRTKKTTKEEQTVGAAPAEEKKVTKRTTSRKPRATKKKAEDKEVKIEVNDNLKAEPKVEPKAEVKDEPKAQNTAEAPAEVKSVNAPAEQKESKAPEQKPVVIPELPNIRIKSIIDLAQAPMRNIVLNDQQIQQLTMEEVEQRYAFLEVALANVLDYDVVISDTNIWLELLVGHTSSHSDPRVNARLQFERQLEFVSKLMKLRGGKFMMMGETYEEIDRFAAMQDPTNHKEADFTDNIVCLNAAARLAKRLILAQQRENRLKIEGISAESHHAAFADPAIVRRVVELFAEGKKVLLLTNDSSVAIRSIGLCDDLQRINSISDERWDADYAPLRPMVFTFDDLKLLDNYTRQFYYIQMAAGKVWMQNVAPFGARTKVEQLTLNPDAFRPGDKHRGDNLFIEQEKTVNTKQQSQPSQKNNKRKNSSASQQKNNTAEQQQKNNTAEQQQKNNTAEQQQVNAKPATAEPAAPKEAPKEAPEAEPVEQKKPTRRRGTRSKKTKEQPKE